MPVPSVVPSRSAAADGAKPSKLDHIQAQMESVASLVLDAGELAGKSAQASLDLGVELKSACADLESITQHGHKKLQWLLLGAGGAMLIALVFFMIMGVRMVSRINQLDAMVVEVGKKVIELNTGLASLDTVNTTLTEMAQRQEALRQASSQIEGRIEASLKQSEALVQQVPAQTAQQVAATSENLVKQVQGINARLQTQASAVQTLAKDVQSLKGSVNNVDKLNRDVQALVTLQRERYLEAIQKNQAASAAAAAAAKEASTPPAQTRERSVQYPRVAPSPNTEASRAP
jgi:methyl-accepting chemotaxis protein